MAQTGESQKEREEKNNTKVDIANSVSIMDYANKNNIDVVYEDQRVARITDVDGGILTVFKESNSWTAGNEEYDESNSYDGKSYGNTIRFVARLEHADWRDAMNLLVEERSDYLSAEEYNEAYSLEFEPNNSETTGSKPVKVSSKNNNELNKAKSISISDYARDIGLPVKELHSGRFAVIDDPKYDGLIIYNQTNTWEWSSKFIKDSNVVDFVERVQKIGREKALEGLIAYADTGKILEKEKIFEEQSVETSIIEKKEDLKEAEESVINAPEQVNVDEKKEVSQKIIDNEEKEVFLSKENSRKTMSKEQLSEILSGYRRGIDVSSFDNSELKPEQMRELRIAKQNGINTEDFSYPGLSAAYMKEMRLAAQSGLALKIFKNDNNEFIFNAEQAKEIRLGHQNGLSLKAIDTYAKEGLGAETMKEVRLGLQDGIEQMNKLNLENYSAKDLHAIRMTIMVNHIIDTIKVHLRNLYDSIIALIKRSITSDRIEQNNFSENVRADGKTETMEQPAEVDMEKEAVYEFREVIENIYEAMAEELQELSLEDKKKAIISSFRSILQQAREMEQTVAAKNHDEINKAVDEFIEERETESLKQSAYQSLQDEYVEQFFDNENHYNEQLIEFSNSVISNNFIAQDQKAEILHKTLGAVFGDEVAENWIKHLPADQQSELELNQEQLRMIREEYEQVTTVTEVAEYEAG